MNPSRVAPWLRVAAAGLCVAIPAIAWWWDRGQIVGELRDARAELDAFRRAREDAEALGPLRQTNKISGLEEVATGMTVGEVEEILGGPATFRNVQKGRVVDSSTFVINFDTEVQRKQNHRDYDFRQWQAGNRIGVVIFDDQGRVVCRY